MTGQRRRPALLPGILLLGISALAPPGPAFAGCPGRGCRRDQTGCGFRSEAHFRLVVPLTNVQAFLADTRERELGGPALAARLRGPVRRALGTAAAIPCCNQLSVDRCFRRTGRYFDRSCRRIITFESRLRTAFHHGRIGREATAQLVQLAPDACRLQIPEFPVPFDGVSVPSTPAAASR